MIKEITFEITNYCPHECKFCSSEASPTGKVFLKIDEIEKILDGNYFNCINLSGGEPLSHPDFYNILDLCKKHADDVIVYTNALTHIRYNLHVIDGIYVEANATVLPGTDKIHLLKRIPQGREAKRPEVHLSRNWDEDCSCDHRVVRPDGSVGLTPCNKYNFLEKDDMADESKSNFMFYDLYVPDTKHHFQQYVVPDMSFHWEEFSMSLSDVELPDVTYSWENN